MRLPLARSEGKGYGCTLMKQVGVVKYFFVDLVHYVDTVLLFKNFLPNFMLCVIKQFLYGCLYPKKIS